MPAWLRELLRRPGGLVGTVIVLVVLFSAALSLFWTPLNPFAADPFNQWLLPSPEHLLGTDGIGRDIFSYLLAGTRTTVTVAFFSALVAAVIGIALAALGSLTTRWVRESAAVGIDILVAFPTLLIAVMLAAVFGGSIAVVIVAVGIGFGFNIARVSRGEIRRVYRADYVIAAQAAGAGPVRTLTRHILPNIAPTFIVQLSLAAAVSILAEAGLSFLGYGAPANTASWGRLLSALQNYLAVHPVAMLWPGLAITITVLGFTLLGDALRDATDPRLKSGFAHGRADGGADAAEGNS